MSKFFIGILSVLFFLLFFQTIEAAAPSQPAVTITDPLHLVTNVLWPPWTMQAVDPDGDMVQFEIDHGDGSILVTTSFTASGTTLPYSYTYVTPGTYTVQVIAIDTTGERSTPVSIPVTVHAFNPTPPPSFSASLTADVVNTVAPGDPVVLTYDKGSDFLLCDIWGSDGTIINIDSSQSGTQTVYPTTNVSYALVCTWGSHVGNGTISYGAGIPYVIDRVEQISVGSVSAPPVIDSFTNNPASISYANAVELRWVTSGGPIDSGGCTVTNLTESIIHGGYDGNSSDLFDPTIVGSVTYSVTCYGSGGVSNTLQTTINVNPYCPFVSDADTTVVVFPINPLYANLTGADSRSVRVPLATPLSSGNYDIRLASYDPHLSQTTHRHQVNERYRVALFNSGGTNFMDTGVISDLPDLQEEQTELVNLNVSIGQDVHEVQALHDVYPAPGYESIYPVCVAFDEVGAVPECDDGIDNDGDGLVDYFSDPGCLSEIDDDESNAPPSCTYQQLTSVCNPSWSACPTSLNPGDPYDSSVGISCALNTTAIRCGERRFVGSVSAQALHCGSTLPSAQCADGVDNDGDGVIDTDDPGCHWDSDPTNPASYRSTHNTEKDVLCPFVSDTDTVVINFPLNEVIRAELGIASAQGNPISLATPIPAGTYDVRLASYDDHLPLSAHGTQLKEQFYVKLYNNSGVNFMDTSAISDIPDIEEERNEVVDIGLVVSEDIYQVQSFHDVYPAPGPESVIPVCVAFDSTVSPPVSVSLSSDADASELASFDGVVKGNDRVNLTWSSTNATACTAVSGAGFSTGGALGDVSPASDLSAPLTSDQTFTIECTGPGGSDTDTLEIGVIPAVEVFTPFGSVDVIDGGDVVVTWGNVVGTTGTTCYGDVSGGATDGGWGGTKAIPSGVINETISNVTNSGTYTLICNNQHGSSPPPPLIHINVLEPSANLSATPLQVLRGKTVEITWELNHVQSAVIEYQTASSPTWTHEYTHPGPVTTTGINGDGTLTSIPITEPTKYRLTFGTLTGTFSKSVALDLDAFVPDIIEE